MELLKFTTSDNQSSEYACSGYSGEKFASAVKKTDLHTFKVMPKRWTTHFCLAYIAGFGCERKLPSN